MVKNYLYLLLILPLFLSCKKEEIQQKIIHKNIHLQAEYIYDLGNIQLYQEGIEKPNIKTLQEFASIAYAELFGTTIPAQKIMELSLAYVSFGDKKMVEDLIVRNFLNLPGLQIPSATDMNNDLDLFLHNTYRKFFTREPNAFELWQWKSYLTDHPSVTPTMVYYTFMTADEYRYY